MSISPKLIPLLVFAALLGASTAEAQTSRASVRGRVTDQSGTPVASASVRAARGDTGESRTATTNEAGLFSLVELEPGEYRFDVTTAGFAPYTRQAQLAVGQDLWLDVPLPVTMRQDVDVSAPFVPVERDSAAMAHADRPASGRRAAARRPQLPRARAAGAGHRAGAAGFGQLGARRLRVQRQRRARGRQRLPARRRLQHRPEARHRRRPAAGRRHLRVRGPDLDLRRVVRPQRRRAGQRGHQVRRQPLQRHRVRVLPQRRARRPERLRAARRAGAGLQPQSVRRLARRADRAPTGCSSSPTTRARGCARASPASPTCRRWRSGRATSRSRCSRRPINPFSRQPFPGGRIPSFAINPIGAAIAGALSRCRTAAPPFANYVSSPTSTDDVDQFDARLDHTFAGASRLDRPIQLQRSAAARAVTPAPASRPCPVSATTSTRRGQNLSLRLQPAVGNALVNDLALRLQPRGHRGVRSRTRRSAIARSA